MDKLDFDQDLLARYDRPGPRYTSYSYPTAPQFHADFGEAALRQAAATSNAQGRALSLYVHVPFCASPCFYCGCNRVITRDKARGEAYLAHLFREIELAAPLFDAARPVTQLHFGGGTPNFLSPSQLGDVVAKLKQHFNFADMRGSDISIELDPRFVSPTDIAALAAPGFNRASFGVQDFNPAVQQAVNRVQTVEETRAVVEACRATGFRSVNVDLIYGLPRQALEGFCQTLDTITAMRPDRVAVYGYAHLPRLFRPQRQIIEAELPDAHTRLALLQSAIEKLSAAGYDYIGMDHFALPEDELSVAQRRSDLHRNFMGYTTRGGSDLFGLGVSAISHVGDSFSQNPRDLAGWKQALEHGQLPLFRGMSMDADDILRAQLIQALMCQGEIAIRELEQRHGIHFAHYFADALAKLRGHADDGLVEISPDYLRAAARGRLLLRNLAMCFDRYLQPPAESAVPRFSRAI